MAKELEEARTTIRGIPVHIQEQATKLKGLHVKELVEADEKYHTRFHRHAEAHAREVAGLEQKLEAANQNAEDDRTEAMNQQQEVQNLVVSCACAVLLHA